ncbi:uncharacterized protein VTP21DRAFT_11248 [Calcarisporiella thermophila]|uniref:uncharacterized protein n=1 Tax=Calcarisporiella thermophila TaxID=911321 RepID=UPI0037448DDD
MSVYNHRPMAPPGRTSDLLDQIKAEFESLSQEASVSKMRLDDYEHKFAQQIQEMNLFKQTLMELEQTHVRFKQQCEEEIARLRRENEQLRAGHQVPPSSGHPPTSQATTPRPPQLGHAQSNLFGGIMGARQQGGLPPSSGPPPGADPHHPPPSHYPPSAAAAGAGGSNYVNGNGLPPPSSQQQQQMLPTPTQQQQPPQQQPQHQQHPPPVQALQQTPKRRGEIEAAGTHAPHQAAAAAHAGYAPGGMPGVSPKPAMGGTGFPYHDIDNEAVPAALRKEGHDWFALFNPKVPRLLDVDLKHILEHNSVVCCVRFSSNGQYLATGCNRSAQIYDVQTGKMITMLIDENIARDGSDLYIRSVCFSPNDQFLATGAEDRQIRIWDIASKRVRQVLSGHEQDIYSLDWSRDGQRIVSGSGDRTTRVWDAETGQCLHVLTIEEAGQKDAGVTSVAISPDGRLVAAGSLDKMVRVWDAQTGYPLDQLEGHKDSVYSVAFGPDGKLLVSGSLDRALRLWDLSGLGRPGANGTGGGAQAGKPSGGAVCRQILTGHKDFVLSVAISPCGTWVISGSKDRSVQVWDARTGQSQFMLQGHKNSVISVALSPKGQPLFATGSGDCKAKLWAYHASPGVP